MTTAEALKTELETYNRNKADLVRQAEGKFVVIHNDEIAGIWVSYEDALKAGYERYGLRPFLVKQIEGVEKVHSITTASATN